MRGPDPLTIFSKEWYSLRFAVTGGDPRFTVLKRLLEADGHIVTSPEKADVIVPSPADPAAFYARSESYLAANAALTAEGAVALLAGEKALPGTQALVLGFGRVGSLTALALAKAGCRVTVLARRRESRTWAEAMGLQAAPFSRLPELLPGAELLVNTVPERVLPRELLELLPKDAVLLELASAPGGIDGEGARNLHLHIIRAGGLPGKYAPEKAAAILRDAVYEVLAAPRPRLGVGICGSHCTFDKTLDALAPLRRDYELVPILSAAAAGTDTRFAAAEAFRATLEGLCGRSAVDSVKGAEPLGTSEALDLLLVAPCTGNTLAKLASGVTDTPVTMACKAHLRNGRPLVLAVSTNDGLSGSAENIGRLLQRKNVYFVPFRQDSPSEKPFSLQSDFSLLPETLASAREGKQLQPVLAL